MECFHLNLITGIVLYDFANYDVAYLQTCSTHMSTIQPNSSLSSLS